MGEHARLSAAATGSRGGRFDSCLTAALLLALALATSSPAFAGRCAASSARHTAALVELYTAEVCAGCAQAEAWLSALARVRPAGSVIPIFLRVDDRRHAREGEVRERLASRQRRLLPLQRTALVYSPQVLLQGREFPDWNRPEALGPALDRIGDRPEQAHITIAIHAAGHGHVAAAVEAQILDAGQIAESALYLAPVTGEPHRRAVLEWLGPVGARPTGRISVSLVFALASPAAAHNSGVAAFVQNRRTREVLQALVLAACSP